MPGEPCQNFVERVFLSRLLRVPVDRQQGQALLAQLAVPSLASRLSGTIPSVIGLTPSSVMAELPPVGAETVARGSCDDGGPCSKRSTRLCSRGRDQPRSTIR
jgi:hypothetical protein